MSKQTYCRMYAEWELWMSIGSYCTNNTRRKNRLVKPYINLELQLNYGYMRNNIRLLDWLNSIKYSPSWICSDSTFIPLSCIHIYIQLHTWAQICCVNYVALFYIYTTYNTTRLAQLVVQTCLIDIILFIITCFQLILTYWTIWSVKFTLICYTHVCYKTYRYLNRYQSYPSFR